MWWQQNSLEWCYRLLKEPRRMWKDILLATCCLYGICVKSVDIHCNIDKSNDYGISMLMEFLRSFTELVVLIIRCLYIK